MANRLSVPYRVATALTWPVAVSLTAWDYMWRLTVLHRSETSGSDLQGHLPPELPADVEAHDLQGPEHGHGPLYHRLYRIEITDAALSAAELMSAICADLQRAVPSRLARFRRTSGERGRVAVGDEFVVRMPGPWDGPVRVVSRDPESFRLHTLSEHLEAGQIRFSAHAGEDEGRLSFAIESWTRSGDAFSDVLYNRLHIAKEVQAHMWISFLENAAAISGGSARRGVDVSTHLVDYPAGSSTAASAESSFS